MKRLTLAVVVVATLGIGAAAAWLTFGRTESAAPPSTVAVTRGNVEETVLAAGMLEASILVSVGAQVSGIVKSVDVTLGQDVAAGDLIAEIDSLDQENAVKSAQASLANMQAQKTAQQAAVAQAQKALERADEMSRQQLISDTDHETAQANLANAQAQLAGYDAQIQQATINVQTAELNLSRTRITAPISGTVVAVAVKQGQTVNAQQSTPTIVKIAKLDSMLIKAEISEADVTRVQPGQKVYFTILGDPGSRIEATLRSIEPAPSSIASDTSTDSSAAIYYNGIFEVPNPDRTLRISMTAQVTIVLDDANDALILPASAVTSDPGGRSMVRLYDESTGAITPTPVKVGINNSVLAEIEAGLDEGDLVVALGTVTAAAAPPMGTGGMGAMGGGMSGPPPGM